MGPRWVCLALGLAGHQEDAAGAMNLNAKAQMGKVLARVHTDQLQTIALRSLGKVR